MEGAAAAAREPRMQLWSRGCSYGGADAFRDPPAVPPSVYTAITMTNFGQNPVLATKTNT